MMASKGAPIDKVLYVVTILYMVLIFYLSSMPSIRQPGPLEDVPNIDKLEHFMEFMVLGLLMYLSFHFSKGETVRRSAWMFALLGAITYACTDEIHQLFVPGRSPDLIDLLADSTGISVACFIGAWMSEKRSYMTGGVSVKLNKAMVDSEE